MTAPELSRTAPSSVAVVTCAWMAVDVSKNSDATKNPQRIRPASDIAAPRAKLRMLYGVQYNTQWSKRQPRLGISLLLIMRFLIMRGAAAAALFSLVAGVCASVAAQDVAPIWAGVYTAAQADRGRGVIQSHCSECH